MSVQSMIRQAAAIHTKASYCAWKAIPRAHILKKMQFYLSHPVVQYVVRAKVDRVLSEGMDIQCDVDVFPDKQEAFIEYLKRTIPERFLRPCYVWVIVVGWFGWTYVPDKEFGASFAAIPPWLEGLEVRYTDIGGEAQLRLDEEFISHSGGSLQLMNRLFHALTSGAAFTPDGHYSAALQSQLGTHQGILDNAFSPLNSTPGFEFLPPIEIRMAKMGPWNETFQGTETPIDALMKNRWFSDSVRMLWLAMLRERVSEPVYLSKQEKTLGKNEPSTTSDTTDLVMERCLAASNVHGLNEAASSGISEEQKRARRHGAVISDLWAEITAQGIDPKTVLPPHWGGNADFTPKEGRERRLPDGVVVQRGNNPGSLPDISWLDARLSEDAGMAFRVPISLASRSSDSGGAKLWSTGGDDIALRMMQQSCAPDCTFLEGVLQDAFISAFEWQCRCAAAIASLCAKKRKTDESRVMIELQRDGEDDTDVKMGGDTTSNYYSTSSEVADNTNRKYRLKKPNPYTDERSGSSRASDISEDEQQPGLSKDEKQLIVGYVKETRKRSYPWSDGERGGGGGGGGEGTDKLRGKDFRSLIRFKLLGNVEWSDIKDLSDEGKMEWETQRRLISAKKHIPIEWITKTIITPPRMAVLEEEADINAKAKAKAKPPASGGGGGKKR